LLKETDKLGCKPAKTQIQTNIKLNTDIGEPLKDINYFKKFIEKLIYLMVTRPELSFIISHVTQFIYASRIPYLGAINRILIYLKGTREENLDEKKMILMLYVTIPMQIELEALIENQ
jgi:hypothetical protein